MGESSSLQFATLPLLFSRFGAPHTKPCCRSGPRGWRWAGRTFPGECPWTQHLWGGGERAAGRGGGLELLPRPLWAGQALRSWGARLHPGGASGQHPRAATAALVCGSRVRPLASIRSLQPRRLRAPGASKVRNQVKRRSRGVSCPQGPRETLTPGEAGAVAARRSSELMSFPSRAPGPVRPDR